MVRMMVAAAIVLTLCTGCVAMATKPQEPTQQTGGASGAAGVGVGSAQAQLDLAVRNQLVLQSEVAGVKDLVVDMSKRINISAPTSQPIRQEGGAGDDHLSAMVNDPRIVYILTIVAGGVAVVSMVLSTRRAKAESAERVAIVEGMVEATNKQTAAIVANSEHISAIPANVELRLNPHFNSLHAAVGARPAYPYYPPPMPVAPVATPPRQVPPVAE